MFLPGYNTNGFAHHRLEDAFEILSEIGYRSIALTVEHDLLNPPNRAGVAVAVKRILKLLERHPMEITIETGSRFLLDPRRKHQPTLISSDAAGRIKRLDFLMACVDLAAETRAQSVSLWSGAPEASAPGSVLFDRLLDGMRALLDHARKKQVRISFEPEPGMLIAKMTEFATLFKDLADPLFGLTLDIGHVHCLRDGDAADHIRTWQNQLWNIHIEDMHRDQHEHLPFGRGDIDFEPIFDALKDIDYRGPVHVELSRQSHVAVEAARESYQFLRKF